MNPGSNMSQRKIIAQCNTADFKYLEHLTDKLGHGESIHQDCANFTLKQKMAVTVLHHFQDCGVPFKWLLKLREVLIWENPDKTLLFEYRLLDPHDDATKLVLRLMKPKSERR